MITLEIILDGQFPVRLNPIGFAVRNFGVLEIIGAKGFANILKRCHQIAGIGVTINKHQTHIGHALHGLQAVCGGVKVRHNMSFARSFE